MSGTTAEKRRAGRTDSPEVVRVREESPESSFRELDDVFLQTQARIWLGEVLHIRLDEETPISDLLSDGELLFQVSKMIWKMFLKKNVGQKSSNIFIYERTSFAKTDGRYMAYPKVDSFLKICQILGLTGVDLCSPSDVVEKRDVRRVCMCIRSLSKKARLRNLKVPDFDIVTYTIAMPTNLVGGIRRYLEQSRHTQSNSNVYFTSKKKTFSKHQDPLHALLSEFDEAESIFNEREIESHFRGDSSVSNDLFNLDENTLEESSEEEGSLSELQEDFRTKNYEGENLHKGTYSAEIDHILWPLSLSASAKQVQNHYADCKQIFGSSEQTSPTDSMESCKFPRSHFSTCLLPDCHARPGGVKEEIMNRTAGNKSKTMFNEKGETSDVEFECMNQKAFQEDCSADPLESHYEECSEKVWLLIKKLEDAFQGVSNKTETRGEKSGGSNTDVSPRNSLYQSPSLEDSISSVRGTTEYNSDRIYSENICFSDSEIPGSTIHLCTEARDSQTDISYGYEFENIEHDTDSEISSHDSLKAIPVMATGPIPDDQYYEEKNDYMFLLPEKYTCKAVEKFKIIQNRSPSQHGSNLRNSDILVLENCDPDIEDERVSRSFCFTSEIHELHQSTKSEDVINMKTSSIVEDLQQASAGIVSSSTLKNYCTDMPYSSTDSRNIELLQPEKSYGKHATIIQDGSNCDKSSDTSPCYVCSAPSEETIKSEDAISNMEDFFSPILEEAKNAQHQDSPVHIDVTDPASAQERVSCNPGTPVMCKSTSTMKGDESGTELVIKDSNAEIQVRMIGKFVETLHNKQHAADILDGFYCDNSSDTLQYYTCSIPSQETIKPSNTMSDKEDFTSTISVRVEHEQLPDLPVYSDVADAALVLETSCNPETPMMCKDWNAEIQVKMMGELAETLHKKQHAAQILDGCYYDKFSDTLSYYMYSTSGDETIKPADTVSGKEDFSSPILESVKNEQLQDSPIHSDATDAASVQESEASSKMSICPTLIINGAESGSELAIKNCNAEIQVRMIGELIEQECTSYHDLFEPQKDVFMEDTRILEKNVDRMLNQDTEFENITESFTESNSAAMAEVCNDYEQQLFFPEASEVCIDQIEVLPTPSRFCGQLTSLEESNGQQLSVSIATENSPADDTGHVFQQQMQDCDFSFSDDTDMFGNDVIKNVVYVENLNVDCIDIAEFPGLHTEETKGAEEYRIGQHPCLEDNHIMEPRNMDHSHANIPNPRLICKIASLCGDKKQNQHAPLYSFLRDINEEEAVAPAEQNIDLKIQVLLDDHTNSMDQEARYRIIQSKKDTKEISSKQVPSSDSNVKEKDHKKPVRKVIKTVAGSVTLIGALLFLHHFRKKKSGESCGQIPVLLQNPKPQHSGIYQQHKVEASNSDVVYYPGERLKL